MLGTLDGIQHGLFTRLKIRVGVRQASEEPATHTFQPATPRESIERKSRNAPAINGNASPRDATLRCQFPSNRSASTQASRSRLDRNTTGDANSEPSSACRTPTPYGQCNPYQYLLAMIHPFLETATIPKPSRHRQVHRTRRHHRHRRAHATCRPACNHLATSNHPRTRKA